MVNVRTLAREVVAKRLAITAAITALASAAVSLHWITATTSDDVDTWLIRGLDVLALIISTAWVRSGVTPADPNLAPTSSNGLPLAETGTAEPPPPQ